MENAAKTLFVDENKTEKVDLGSGFWIELPMAISYGKFESLIKDGELETRNDKKLIAQLAIGWNLTEEDGSPAPLNEENLKRLPTSLVTEIKNNLSEKIILDKKK